MYIYSSELPSRVTWLLLLQGREGPKAVRKILLVPCDHHHRLGKHKGETSHDNVSTSHRARRQLGTSTVLRTVQHTDSSYTTGFLTPPRSGTRMLTVPD